jgi:chromate transporter
MKVEPNGWLGATLALVSIFLPSFLLIIGTLPFWEAMRRRPRARSALRGVNAAVLGLLLAALYNPVWTAGIAGPADFALAASAFLLLLMWQTPPWLVVALCAVGGATLG